MNDNDKFLVKEVALATVDGIISTLEVVLPGISIPFNMSKALYGAGMKLREKKVLEWVEMIRDNPSIITQKVISDEKFQDGFVFALERYLIERNEEKRRIFRSIFLGFANAKDKEMFPLEKFIHTLSQLSEKDIEVLRDVKIDEGLNYKNYQIYGGNYERIENIYNLIGVGLLLDVTNDRVGHHPDNSPFVKPTPFCKEFVQYIKNEE
jgi:hypothetical protein